MGRRTRYVRAAYCLAFVGAVLAAGAFTLDSASSAKNVGPPHAARLHALSRSTRRQEGRISHQALGPPTLTAVSSEVLAHRGYVLDSPRSRPLVTEQAAVRDLEARFGGLGAGTQIQQAVLASVHLITQNEQADQLDWVISLVPPGASWQGGGGSVSVRYFVAFVSAEETGQRMSAVIAGAPVAQNAACCPVTRPIPHPTSPKH